MRPSDRAGSSQPVDTRSPMLELHSPRFADSETVVKREIDAYYMSQVTDSATLLLGEDQFRIQSAIDLPDTEYAGLTYKLRLVEIQGGPCWLLARWKPDRYMRRAAAGISQKWFVEKELHVPDPGQFFEEYARTMGTESVD